MLLVYNHHSRETEQGLIYEDAHVAARLSYIIVGYRFKPLVLRFKEHLIGMKVLVLSQNFTIP